MTTETDPNDPRSLIHEAFSMPELTEPDCRTIFLDWALSLPDTVQAPDALQALFARYQDTAHPMRAVLAEGMARPANVKRRSGRRRTGPRGTS